MTRYREEGVLIDGYPVYAISYPADWHVFRPQY
jgi:hypothetical protein